MSSIQMSNENELMVAASTSEIKVEEEDLDFEIPPFVGCPCTSHEHHIHSPPKVIIRDSGPHPMAMATEQKFDRAWEWNEFPAGEVSEHGNEADVQNELVESIEQEDESTTLRRLLDDAIERYSRCAQVMKEVKGAIDSICDRLEKVEAERDRRAKKRKSFELGQGQENVRSAKRPAIEPEAFPSNS